MLTLAQDETKPGDPLSPHLKIPRGTCMSLGKGLAIPSWSKPTNSWHLSNKPQAALLYTLYFLIVFQRQRKGNGLRR